jgi:hypothetical protein
MGVHAFFRCRMPTRPHAVETSAEEVCTTAPQHGTRGRTAAVHTEQHYSSALPEYGCLYTFEGGWTSNSGAFARNGLRTPEKHAPP